MLRMRHALIVALAFAGTACGGSDDMLGLDRGRVRFVLAAGDAAPAGVAGPSAVAAESDADASLGTGADPEHGDAPHLGIASANVTFSSVLARNLDGVLVDVEMNPPLPVTVDVMRLEGGTRQIQLPEGTLPEGSYDQLVVVLTALELTTLDGTKITIDPSGGGWTAIVPLCPFTVGTETTTVALQFSVRRSFLWRDNRFHFQPRLECAADDGAEADS